MSANMYRVGDYVFFETSSTAPYQIRRIEELNKTQNGNVEAKVMCFYRRRDISNSLIVLADKHHKLDDDTPSPKPDGETNGTNGISKSKVEENGLEDTVNGNNNNTHPFQETVEAWKKSPSPSGISSSTASCFCLDKWKPYLPHISVENAVLPY